MAKCHVSVNEPKKESMSAVLWPEEIKNLIYTLDKFVAQLDLKLNSVTSRLEQSTSVHETFTLNEYTKQIEQSNSVSKKSDYFYFNDPRSMK